MKQNIKPAYYTIESQTPMAFFKFYVYVRPILHIALNLQTWITWIISDCDILSFMVWIAIMAVYLFSIIGLIRRKYWGYVLNNIALALPPVLSFFDALPYVIMEDYITASSKIATLFVQTIVNTLIFIYFRKRKYLFGAKLPHIEHINNEQASPQQVQTLTCICGSCGKTAKISYAAQTGGSCTVSFVCPYCRTKNVVRNGSREKYNNNHFDFDPSHAYEQTHGRRQNKSNIKAFIARNKILCIVSAIAVLLIAGAFAGGYFAGQNSIIINHSHTVYVSSTGGKYHLYDCKYINKSKILARTIETARKKGYEPCSHCNPDRLINKK